MIKMKLIAVLVLYLVLIANVFAQQTNSTTMNSTGKRSIEMYESKILGAT